MTGKKWWAREKDIVWKLWRDAAHDTVPILQRRDAEKRDVSGIPRSGRSGLRYWLSNHALGLSCYDCSLISSILRTTSSWNATGGRCIPSKVAAQSSTGSCAQGYWYIERHDIKSQPILSPRTPAAIGRAVDVARGIIGWEVSRMREARASQVCRRECGDQSHR